MHEQPHLDQVIVRLMNKTKGYKINPPSASTVDIRTGKVLVGDQRISFEPRNLLDGKIQMILPKDFREIAPETVYKPESRPDLILADESGSIQITLAHLAKKVSDNAEVMAHKNEVQQLLQRMNSSIEWLPGGLKDVCGQQASFFEFTVPMLGASVYNLSFFMELDGRVLNGSFVCNDRKLKAWNPFFVQMLESIEFMDSQADSSDGNSLHPDFSDYHFKEGLYAIYKGKEYPLYKIGAAQYRLISIEPSDCKNGFVAQDGVYKKTVTKSEIQAAYQLKLTLVYHGYSFKPGAQRKGQVELIASQCDRIMKEELQLDLNSERKYVKWVSKNEIEDVTETKLAIAGFVTPGELK